MRHRQAQELLPGYVLGALEMREQKDLLEHVQSCSVCYQLAQEQVEVGGMFASTIAESDPSIALKARVQASMAAPASNNDIDAND